MGDLVRVLTLGGAEFLADGGDGEYGESLPSVAVTDAADRAGVLDHLAASAVDCLVVACSATEDPIGLVQAVREDASDLPIVVLVDPPTADLARRALSAGASDVMPASDPAFTRVALPARIRSAVDARGRERDPRPYEPVAEVGGDGRAVFDEPGTDRLDEFARIAAHDLRNPLSVAAGRLELARETCDSEHLDAIDDALHRIEALVEDTLAMARHGVADLETEPISLDEAARSAWAVVAAPDASLVVADQATVRADYDRLLRLFENLFRNAVEHGSTSLPSYPRADAVEHGSTSTPSHAQEDAVEHGGSDVTVRVGSTADGFYVADDGPGIPPTARTDVFATGYTTAEDGSGFGLAIVAEIVEAHGWEVAVTESRDGGARFEITGVDVSH